MMNERVKEAVRLIAQGEGQFVEFKTKVNHPEKIIREVVAFANSGGGNLFIGVDDHGTISGLKYPAEDEYVLSKTINEQCKPKIEFKVEFLHYKELDFLHYQIHEGSDKPYFAFLHPKHRYGKSFIRVSDQSIQASYEMRQFLKRSNRYSSPIEFEEKTQALFKYFQTHPSITVDEYIELSGLNKKLASNKLINLALSGALKIEPRKGGDIFLPVE